MTEELLRKIKVESEEELKGLNKYNEYAKLRNRLAIIEEAKASLGLPYTRDMYLPEKTEEEIIMSIYKKYERFIEEKDTNGIYVYMSSYMPSDYTIEEIDEGAPLQIEIPINDSRATHRYYYNLEGFYVECINIEDITSFSQPHTVIYVDNFYELQKEFILTAVAQSQEKAVTKILTKYNKRNVTK